MIFRDMSAEEMLAVSAPLLDPAGNLDPIISKYTLLEGLKAVIEESHDDLLTVHQRSGTNEKMIRQLTADMSHLDARHDAMTRGIYRIVDALVDLALVEAEAQFYRELQETLFPKGLGISQSSYRDQAGTAKRVEERLSDEDRATLAAIDLRGKTLLRHVEEWLEMAQLIGRKEARRAELNSDDSADAVSAGEVRDARLRWGRAVNALINMLEFTDISERDQRVLLANIKDASTKAAAARRRAKVDIDSEIEEDPDPAVVDPAE